MAMVNYNSLSATADANTMGFTNAIFRSKAVPLERWSVFPSKSAAKTYIDDSGIAYEGQLVAINEGETQAVYVLDTSVDDGLRKLADADSLDELKRILDDFGRAYKAKILFSESEAITLTVDDDIFHAKLNIDPGKYWNTTNTGIVFASIGQSYKDRDITTVLDIYKSKSDAYYYICTSQGLYRTVNGDLSNCHTLFTESQINSASSSIGECMRWLNTFHIKNIIELKPYLYAIVCTGQNASPVDYSSRLIIYNSATNTVLTALTGKDTNTGSSVRYEPLLNARLIYTASYINSYEYSDDASHSARLIYTSNNNAELFICVDINIPDIYTITASDISVRQVIKNSADTVVQRTMHMIKYVPDAEDPSSIMYFISHAYNSNGGGGDTSLPGLMYYKAADLEGSIALAGQQDNITLPSNIQTVPELSNCRIYSICPVVQTDDAVDLYVCAYESAGTAGDSNGYVLSDNDEPSPRHIGDNYVGLIPKRMLWRLEAGSDNEYHATVQDIKTKQPDGSLTSILNIKSIHYSSKTNKFFVIGCTDEDRMMSVYTAKYINEPFVKSMNINTGNEAYPRIIETQNMLYVNCLPFPDVRLNSDNYLLTNTGDIADVKLCENNQSCRALYNMAEKYYQLEIEGVLHQEPRLELINMCQFAYRSEEDGQYIVHAYVTDLNYSASATIQSSSLGDNSILALQSDIPIKTLFINDRSYTPNENGELHITGLKDESVINQLIRDVNELKTELAGAADAIKDILGDNA